MKKLTAIFCLLFLFLLAFPLVTNQLIHHSLVTPVNGTKTLDQLAKEAWEYKKKEVGGDGVTRDYDYPLQLQKGRLFYLKKMEINGINQENNNLLETVKETAPLKTYVQLSEKVKTELRNLIQIPDWAKKLRDLYEKTERKWEKIFWDKIRKKYFSYLKKYNINLIIQFFGGHFPLHIELLSSPDISLSFENLSAKQKKIIPSIYFNAWELSFQKTIIITAFKVGDVVSFVSAKAIWEDNICSTYLADLKKYQIREIAEVEIASLLTLTRESEFVNFTLQQQDQIHNLVDLPNYLTLLKAAINQKRQEEKTVTTFWNNASKREKIKQLLNYGLFTVANISLNQFTSNDLVKTFSNLTNQQQKQLKQLINLENYASKIALLLSEEKQAADFWTNAINKKLLANLFQFSITMLDEVKINQLNKDLLTSDYLTLTSKQKDQVRSLSKLTNFSQAVQQAVVKAKEKEKTNQLPLILGLSLGLPSLLLVVIVSYLYWKKQKQKASKNSHK